MNIVYIYTADHSSVLYKWKYSCQILVKFKNNILNI